MIPRTKVQLTVDFPVGYKFWTPKSDDYSEEGFRFFRGTWLIRGVGVRQARALIAIEGRLASIVDSLAANPTEFDKLASSIESCDRDNLPESLVALLTDDERNAVANEDFAPLEGLELGVAGLAYALAAVGCWPAASCRGHPGDRAWSATPAVFVALDRHRGMVLQRFVTEARCGFDQDGSRDNLLVIHAESIEDTMCLANLVVGERKAFTPRRGPRPTRDASGHLQRRLFD